MILGLVLAGGRSIRFGREKAMADLAGRPLIAWAADALAAGCAEVAVNARAEAEAAQFAARCGLVRLPDAPDAPAGPLAGVQTGLAWAQVHGATLLATAPCDTPLLPHALVPRLAAALGGGHGATVACTEEGLQPLCALWRVSALEAVSNALADGRHPPIRALLAELNAVEVAFTPAALFANVNTPTDHAAALARLTMTATPS